MDKIAKLVRDVSEDFAGTARLYRLIPPLAVTRYDADGDEVEHFAEYVVASAAVVPFSGPETYVFEANGSGEVVCWGELEGSSRGRLDCDGAIRAAGYEVQED